MGFSGNFKRVRTVQRMQCEDHGKCNGVIPCRYLSRVALHVIPIWQEP
jgi:hypothetical protein